MIPIKIKAKLNAYTKVSPLDNQFVDAPVDDNLYGRKNGIWVQIDENSSNIVSACFFSAAIVKLGRYPCVTSPASVNCETKRNSPSTSDTDKFVLPQSSE